MDMGEARWLEICVFYTSEAVDIVMVSIMKLLSMAFISRLLCTVCLDPLGDYTYDFDHQSRLQNYARGNPAVP